MINPIRLFPQLTAVLPAVMLIVATFAMPQFAEPARAQTTAAPQSSPVDEAKAKQVREAISKWTKGRYKVQEVRTTPIPGLLEIRIGNDLLFVDESARYLVIEGEMFDIAGNRNLTRERMQEVMAIRFEDLPIDKAVKQVNGKGERVVALFEDPNCGYCKRLRADLMTIDNLTIYTFAYPILAADSDTKSRRALCADNPSDAWNALMLQGVVPDNDGSCDNSLDQFKALGERYGIQATPTMFFPSGVRMQGYAPPTRFVETLNKNQSKTPG
ncbi:MAG: DsbC family protein [Burkholderiaceae bacterium]